MPEATLSVQFEWWMDRSRRTLVLEALQDVGIPVHVLDDVPPPPPSEGQKGGGPGPPLPIDLILQHGFNIVDGLITTGIVFGLAKALKKVRQVYGSVRIRIDRLRGTETTDDRVTVFYDISLSAYGGFEGKALLEIAEDYPRVVKEAARVLRPAGRDDQFETTDLVIYRTSRAIRTGQIYADERDPDVDPRG